MFAVIETGGKQYRVSPKQIIKIEKLSSQPGDQVVFDQVRLIGRDDTHKLSPQELAGSSVVGELLSHEKDKKIVIFKKRRRQNSRRKNGHRQPFSLVRIDEILMDGAKPSPRAKPDKTQEKPAAKASDDKSARSKAAETQGKAAAKAPEVKSKSASADKDLSKDKSQPSAVMFDAAGITPDNLKKLPAVGPVLEKKLKGIGLISFQQIVDLSEDDFAKIASELGLASSISLAGWQEAAREELAQ